MFDDFVDGFFIASPDGNVYYAPWGLFGKTYRIDTDVQRKKIHKWMKPLPLGIFLYSIIIVVGSQYWGDDLLWLLALILPLYVIFYYTVNKYLTKNLIPSDFKLKLKDTFKRSTKTLGVGRMILWFICSLLMLWLGIISVNLPDGLIAGVFLIGTAVIVLIYCLNGLRIRFRERKSRPE